MAWALVSWKLFVDVAVFNISFECNEWIWKCVRIVLQQMKPCDCYEPKTFKRASQGIRKVIHVCWEFSKLLQNNQRINAFLFSWTIDCHQLDMIVINITFHRARIVVPIVAMRVILYTQINQILFIRMNDELIDCHCSSSLKSIWRRKFVRNYSIVAVVVVVVEWMAYTTTSVLTCNVFEFATIMKSLSRTTATTHSLLWQQ